MTDRFQLIFNNWDTNFTFPFVVHKIQLDTIYIDPIWGLKIEKVVANGQLVKPQKYQALLDDVNFGKIFIRDTFIYQVRRLDMVFASQFNQNGDFELEKYHLPENATSIIIEYRLREASHSLGSILTIDSTLG